MMRGSGKVGCSVSSVEGKVPKHALEKNKLQSGL